MRSMATGILRLDQLHTLGFGAQRAHFDALKLLSL